MRKIMGGICAIIFALVLLGTNGLAMQNEMSKTSVDLELAYNFSTETQGLEDNLGAVYDFQNDNGDHEVMLSVSYTNGDDDSYNITFATYNATDGLVITDTDSPRGDSQVYYFEPQNNSAVLNDTFYWTFADTVAPILLGNPNPEPEVTLVELNIGYYALSNNYNEWMVSELGSINSLNFSLVVYQGFLVWSIPGSIIYYTDLDGEQPTDNLLYGDIEGCQRNCIFNDSLWFASDTNLYEMTGSILDPTWNTYDIEKSNQQVTALDVYMDSDDTAHLVICYSNDNVIYELVEGEVEAYITLPSHFDIETIENTRNYGGDFYASGVSEAGRGIVTRITGLTAYEHADIATIDADADALCNLTSTEELYVFNSYDDGDFDCYHYTGGEATPLPDEGEGITITLTQAGHWTTGEAATELFAHTGETITVQARGECTSGLDTMTLQYKNVGDTTYTSVLMTLGTGTDTDGAWIGTIPAQTATGHVYLKITGVSGSDSHTTAVTTLDIIAGTGTTAPVDYLGLLMGFVAVNCCLCWFLLLILLAVLIYYVYRKIKETK